MNKKRIRLSDIYGIAMIGAIAILCGSLFAQQEYIDRKREAKEFRSLLYAESIQDKNIQQAFTYLGSLGYMTELAKFDRNLAVRAEKEPHNFRTDLRRLKYVPWRNTLRYVKESEQFVLNSFGDLEEVKALIQSKLALARGHKIDLPEFGYGARDGVELTWYGFLYEKGPTKRRAIGSQSKSLTLYFIPSDKNKFNQQNYKLERATLKIIHNNMLQDSKQVEFIIDPTPLDDKLDDILIVTRYNYAPPEIYVLGMMHNNKGFSHRLEFKKKYHNYLRNQFLQMFQRIAKYNKFTENVRHEKHLQRLQRGLEF